MSFAIRRPSPDAILSLVKEGSGCLLADYLDFPQSRFRKFERTVRLADPKSQIILSDMGVLLAVERCKHVSKHTPNNNFDSDLPLPGMEETPCSWMRYQQT